ncbi:TetR/AcrR family transcriptional regulator [uncultured Pseudodesulfovibrio sp.]|uniref:TetR/AcrR family transcriptional regulator n=1 Tax=uncultured Pseudodesulfovibrio sp. TaxID=2035858 RepID=UPI0029C66BB9|nr:TetR/AcrR family transcriptional regulator [uncultured Pseudodesulfovibrio sp.]
MERETLRDQRKAETRQRIQDAARLLIARDGFEATTMRGLAREAGVGLGTIALHFQDKTSLLFSAFFDEISEVTRKAIEGSPKDVPLREQFQHMLRTMYGYYGEHTLFLRAVVKEALFATGEWKERFDSQLSEAVDKVAALVEARKATGEVRPDVSAPDVAMICWSLYSAGLIDGLNRELFDADALVHAVMARLDIVLNGVLAGCGHGAK